MSDESQFLFSKFTTFLQMSIKKSFLDCSTTCFRNKHTLYLKIQSQSFYTVPQEQFLTISTAARVAHIVLQNLCVPKKFQGSGQETAVRIFLLLKVLYLQKSVFVSTYMEIISAIITFAYVTIDESIKLNYIKLSLSKISFLEKVTCKNILKSF